MEQTFNFLENLHLYENKNDNVPSYDTLPIDGTEQISQRQQVSKNNELEDLEELLGMNYESFLGSGTYGNVMSFKDKRTDKSYAIKVSENFIFKDTIEGDYLHIHPVLESVILSSVKHPNIIKCHDVLLDIEENKSRLCIVMDKGDVTLDNLYNKTVMFTLKTLYGIINGIEYLHKHKIIHTDLKNNNIVLIDDVPKIIDFGNCILDIPFQAKRITPRTSLYTAPEVYRDEICDEKVDIWSFGIMLIETVNESPFIALEEMNKYKRKDKYPNLHEEVMDKSQLSQISLLERDMGNPIINRILNNIAKDCLQLDPSKRPSAIKIKNMLYPFVSNISNFENGSWKLQSFPLDLNTLSIVENYFRCDKDNLQFNIALSRFMVEKNINETNDYFEISLVVLNFLFSKLKLSNKTNNTAFKILINKYGKDNVFKLIKDLLYTLKFRLLYPPFD